jgi:hypothetical protein
MTNHNPSIDQKIDVLIKIAKQFNKYNVLWHLGASCMLYLRGYVNHFKDIDLMIGMGDVNKVKRILSKYTYHERQANEQYQTKVFLEYEIDGIDIDIMAGFAIVHDSKVFEFPLTFQEPYDELLLDDQVIYLSKVETWLKCYELMGRDDKVKLIENYRVKR